MKMSATELRQRLYQVIDHVIETGEPVEIARRNGSVRIVPDVRSSIWERLEVHEVVRGDLSVDFSEYWDGEPEIEAT